MTMATVGSSNADLIFGEIQSVHDAVSATRPASSNVSLAIRAIITSSARTTSIVKTAAESTRLVHTWVRATPTSDVKVRLKFAEGSPFWLGRDLFWDEPE